MIDPESADPETGFDRGDNDEGFLVRWSRRKQAGYRNQEHPSAPGPQTAPGEPPAAEGLQQTTPQREATDADMPPVDSLDEKSDYAAFMSSGVSEQLRAQALRKLFHLPGFHVPDGLDDYDDDFTQFAKLGNIVTREMERMLLREKQAADATGVASEPDQVDVESEAEAVQNDAAGGVPVKPEDAAPGVGDKETEQGGAPVSQDLDHMHQGHEGTSG